MIERKFIPGSEWLYLKIYTGLKTSDIILAEVIGPITVSLIEEHYISKWFFIRYTDPKPHLRIRFKLKNTENYNIIFDRINDKLSDYVTSGEISNVLLETYNREIERYGLGTIENAEDLFFENSKYTLKCLDFDDEDKIIVSLFYFDEILNKLNLSTQEKLTWIKDFNNTFKKEFSADKKLNSQLDKKYRSFKPKFLYFILSEEFYDERNSIIVSIEKSNSVLHNILFYDKNKSSEVSLKIFFQSIFHMNINRLFTSDQRLFEMIIYDYLYRHYKTLCAR